MSDLLSSVGLGNLTQQFIDEEITVDVIIELTPDDFKELCVRTIGSRIRFVTAAREYLLRRSENSIATNESARHREEVGAEEPAGVPTAEAAEEPTEEAAW